MIILESHVAYVEETRNANKFFVENPIGRDLKMPNYFGG
jgi:hypothetical protein